MRSISLLTQTIHQQHKPVPRPTKQHLPSYLNGYHLKSPHTTNLIGESTPGTTLSTME